MFDRHFPHWPPATPKTLPIPATSLYFNLEICAARYPSKTAIFYYGRSVSYAELRHEVDALAGTVIADWVTQGLATDDGDRIRLTRAGMLVSDGLWSAVLVK